MPPQDQTHPYPSVIAELRALELSSVDALPANVLKLQRRGQRVLGGSGATALRSGSRAGSHVALFDGERCVAIGAVFARKAALSRHRAG